MDAGYIIAWFFLHNFSILVIAGLFKEIYTYYNKLTILYKELEESKKNKKKLLTILNFIGNITIVNCSIIRQNNNFVKVNYKLGVMRNEIY